MQVKAPGELHFCEEAVEHEYWGGRLLQPAGLAAYTAQRARVESQTAPTAAAEEPLQAAGTGPKGHEQAPEGHVVKSELKQEQ